MPSTMTKFAHLQIPLGDIVKATNNFTHDNIIGHSDFSTTYKGQLLRSGRLMNVAARRFDCEHKEADLRFLRELSVLYDLKHTNLVRIIGFCEEKEEKIVVTTYKAYVSLGQHLNNPNLTWTQRLKISIGVARALSFLHYDERRDYAIIHCNINSDTILLNGNWEAKLSGFEFCIKHSVDDKDSVSFCEHVGTMGCTDPTIEKTGCVTYKSDIYSFGVVLFEILCGRKAFLQNEANRFLAPLARSHYENKTLHDIVHPDLQHWSWMSPQSLVNYSNIAYSCLNEDHADRPNMDYIVDELEKALEHQLQCDIIVYLLEYNKPDFCPSAKEKKLGHLKIPLSDIKLATNNFSDTYRYVSVDHYSSYQVELNQFDKENPSSAEEKSTVVIRQYTFGHKYYEKNAFTEIEMLSAIKHPNIITLLGVCVEGSEVIIVTENLSNEYLGDYLLNFVGKCIYSWIERLNICIDVAHALKYLHYEMEDQKVIIHGEISYKSIVLDKNYRAKIVSFWWSVFLPPNQEDEAPYHISISKSSNTDPEYKKTGKLKRESDVYSLGVVMFEILCGRVAWMYDKDGYEGLVNTARQKFCSGTIEDMIDPIIMEENIYFPNRVPNKDSLRTFVELAYKCVAETQDQRPTMKVVVEELEKALFFQVDGTSKKQEAGD